VEPSFDPLADLDFDIREPGWWVRPVLARLSLLAVVIGVLVLMWQERAEAHGGITLLVAGDGRGTVTVTAQWADGHPVTDPLGATLSGSSDAGARVGPVPLRATGSSPGVVGYAGLTTGLWTVVVDVGTPGIGRCEARLPVAATSSDTATPTSVRCAAANPDLAAATAAAVETPGASPPWLAMGVLLIALVAAGVLFAVVARRLAPPPPPAPHPGRRTPRTPPRRPAGAARRTSP
jgi:hypothetical protein